MMVSIENGVRSMYRKFRKFSNVPVAIFLMILFVGAVFFSAQQALACPLPYVPCGVKSCCSQ